MEKVAVARKFCLPLQYRAQNPAIFFNEPPSRLGNRAFHQTSPISLPQATSFLRCTIRECCTLIALRSEEHTSELQSLMRISYAVFCLKKKKKKKKISNHYKYKSKNNI